MQKTAIASAQSVTFSAQTLTQPLSSRRGTRKRWLCNTHPAPLQDTPTCWKMSNCALNAQYWMMKKWLFLEKIKRGCLLHSWRREDCAVQLVMLISQRSVGDGGYAKVARKNATGLGIGHDIMDIECDYSQSWLSFRELSTGKASYHV